MTEQQKHFPEFYVTAPQPCPYLAGRLERKLFTHLTHDKPPALVDNLLKGGFRRSQNIAYMPYCEGCQACVSVRVVVGEFQPGRSLRRVIEINSDLVARRLQATPTSEQYSLFRGYIDARHADGGMADMTRARLRHDGGGQHHRHVRDGVSAQPTAAAARGDKQPLLAVALCDRLSDGISMVYSFYEPEAARRGLGTYMILEHIAYARRLGVPYLYLGYWIQGSPKMSYKKRFQPQEQLTGNGWVRT